MKINSIPPSDIVESYKGKAVRPAQQAECNIKPDRVELSDEAVSFTAVIKEVKDKLDERTDDEKMKIDDVARQIENGTYKVDSSKVAEKMLGGNLDVTV
ncbi:MAG: flagellar biosynthesis anti-sigma factor FlgM [Oscillospiraceae bacterium]|jgi:flagellar biosynthesis anti-sigma factor FlgM